MTKIIRIQHEWNPSKVWLLKHTDCHHFYLSQEVAGRRLYPFKRTTKYAVSEATCRTTGELKKLINSK